MCEPTTMMMAATAVSAGGSIIGGQQRGAELDSQAGQVMAAGADQARKIRRQTQADRGGAVAAMAASGVKIGEGSALETERQIMTIGEEDAMMTLIGARQQARSLRNQASSERLGGWLNAGATVLGGASKLPSWGGR